MSSANNSWYCFIAAPQPADDQKTVEVARQTASGAVDGPAVSIAYREHGTFMIPDVEKQSWPHPAIANGKLFLREQDNLFCYDISAPVESAEMEGRSEERL